MAKSNLVSDDAKVALYHQQGELIDVIDSLLKESEWLEYFYSTAPELNPYMIELQNYDKAMSSRRYV